MKHLDVFNESLLKRKAKYPPAKWLAWYKLAGSTVSSAPTGLHLQMAAA